MMNKIKEINDWDIRLLKLAQYISHWSKDPSTKVEAVIANGKKIISVGYNGFAPNVPDLPELLNDRDKKIKLVIHGEVNALISARQDISGCTLYTFPFAPCSNCAAIFIRAGIKRAVYQKASQSVLSRWKDSLELTAWQFKEAGIETLEIDLVEHCNKKRR